MEPKAYPFRDQARTLREIAEVTGVNFFTLRSRVLKYGFTLEEAVAHNGGPRFYRRPVLYDFRGQCLSIKDIAKLAGVSEGTAYNRRCGNRVLDSDELIDPVKEVPAHAKLLAFRGQTHSIVDWAKLIGIPKDSLYQRLRHGWSLKRALTEPVMQAGQRIIYQKNHRTIRRIAFVILTGGRSPISDRTVGTGAGCIARDLQSEGTPA
ncbi:hypothetical protein ABFT80_07220 [Mesorhizobium sp. SB112]|uniref:hypothetical protein n=1 Tax=Mesorhizobium sp. SB112 TaxID=3151853 RepID=UPI003262F370